MISPELLRKYAFFSLFDEGELVKVAMIAEEERFEQGAVIFHEGEIAESLYFLIGGYVDLYYTVPGVEVLHPEKGIPVGEINPGEPFGISALIEPYRLLATAYVPKTAWVIKIDAPALRSLLELDRKLAYLFTQKVARAAIERLHATRIQLAAAWA